jgi:NADPH:quinone reductase-like Zn-dependent oxidoreductase
MMHAAILEAPGSFVVKELEIPAIKSDELLVKVSTCGICTSELDMWEGKAKGLEFPRFIGHEVSGVVEAVGKDVKSLNPATELRSSQREKDMQNISRSEKRTRLNCFPRHDSISHLVNR